MNRFSTPQDRRFDRSSRGAVLLEVIVALALFTAAAAVIGAALRASVSSLDRLRAQTHAENLAITILSQAQLGALAGPAAGPQPFEVPFADWSWELRVVPVGETLLQESQPLQQIEVIVRQLNGPVTRRLVQWASLEEPSQEESE